MSRQYVADLVVEPPCLNPLAAAITATTETALWPTALYSPINIGECRAGKAWRLNAGGILSTGGSGTLIITPRMGTTTSGITLGASITQTVPVSMTNVAWYLEMTVVCRTVGLAGTNSTAMGTGKLIGAGLAATASTGLNMTFGGTSASFDASIQQGLFIGWTLSVAGSVTPQWVTFQSLN